MLSAYESESFHQQINLSLGTGKLEKLRNWRHVSKEGDSVEEHWEKTCDTLF